MCFAAALGLKYCLYFAIFVLPLLVLMSVQHTLKNVRGRFRSPNVGWRVRSGCFVFQFFISEVVLVQVAERAETASW